MNEVNPDMYSPAERPSSMRAAPAKNRIWSIIGGISSDRVSATGLPVFSVSAATSCSAFSSRVSAIRSSARLRSAGVVSRHFSNASLAAANAAVTSASREIGAVAKASPALGSTTSDRRSYAKSVSCPPTKLVKSVFTARPPFSVFWSARLGSAAARPLHTGLLTRGHAFFASPRRAVVGEQVEERLRGQGLGPEHAGSRPRAGVDQLQRDHGVDRGLPEHGLGAVLGHGPGVVHHVVEVYLA